MAFLKFKAVFKRGKLKDWECGGAELDQLTSDLSLISGFDEVCDYKISEDNESIKLFASFSFEFENGFSERDQDEYFTDIRNIIDEIRGFVSMELVDD